MCVTNCQCYVPYWCCSGTFFVLALLFKGCCVIMNNKTSPPSCYTSPQRHNSCFTVMMVFVVSKFLLCRERVRHYLLGNICWLVIKRESINACALTVLYKQSHALSPEGLHSRLFLRLSMHVSGIHIIYAKSKKCARYFLEKFPAIHCYYLPSFTICPEMLYVYI